MKRIQKTIAATLSFLLALAVLAPNAPLYAQVVAEIGAVGAPVNMPGGINGAVFALPQDSAEGRTLGSPSLGGSMPVLSDPRVEIGATLVTTQNAPPALDGTRNVLFTPLPRAAAPVLGERNVRQEAGVVPENGRQSQMGRTLESVQVQAAAPAAEVSQLGVGEAKIYGSGLFDAFGAARDEASAAYAEDPSSPQGPGLQPSGPAGGGKDSYGGPARVKLNLAQRTGYGLKWGLNMIGIAGFMNLAFILVQLAFSLAGHAGPVGGQENGVDQTVLGKAIHDHPWRLLFVALPPQMLFEEVAFRVIVFGALFGSLVLVRPVTRWLSRVSGGQDTGLGRLIAKADWLASKAFPIAAITAGLLFSAAHFSLWGIALTGILSRTVFAYAMARLMYKTRSIVTPVVAHYLYDALLFLGAIIAIHFALPALAAAYYVALHLFSMWYAWHNWRASKKAA